MGDIFRELPWQQLTDFQTSAFPEIITTQGTNFPVSGLAFDAGADEAAFGRFEAPYFGAAATSIVAKVRWYSRTGQTSGNAVLGGALSVLTPGDAQSILTDSFATETTATQAVNSTASGLTETTLTLTNIDGLVAGDSVQIRIRRLGTNGSDTLTGDLVLVKVLLSYSDA